MGISLRVNVLLLAALALVPGALLRSGYAQDKDPPKQPHADGSAGLKLLPMPEREQTGSEEQAKRQPREAASRQLESLLSQGRLDEALAAITNLTQIAQERQFILSEGIRVIVLSLDALRRGEGQEVRRLIDSAVQSARSVTNPIWELECYRMLTRLGPLGKSETARVQELLGLLTRRTRTPELRPLVEAFLSRTRAALLSSG